MRCKLTVTSQRRVLCVFPAYTSSFGTFSHAYRLMDRVRAFMPPQGLLLIAAYMPESWPVRFVDENIAPAQAGDFAWADVVMVSGMHIQAPQIRDIARRAKAAGKITVLGGPSVSGAPEMYPEFDHLHIGEIGDFTDALDRGARRRVSRRRRRSGAIHQGTAAAHRLPDSRLSPGAAGALPDVHAAILVRLSVPLRILRHSQSLWPAAALQDAAADRRRTRCHLPADRPPAERVFRRRQFHRQPQGCARHAPASRRMAEAARLSHAVRLRGDAQHRQAAGNSRP